MGKEKFREGLIALGYTVEEVRDGWLAIDYPILAGRFAGQTLRVAFEVPGDFDLTPPHGPHMTPRILPVNESATEHGVRMHSSPLGPEWGHLSRPFPNWQNTNRTVKEYLRWVKHLFETL
jgi:hypothetical protein